MKRESVRELQRREKAGKVMWLKELREKGIRFRTFHIVDRKDDVIVTAFRAIHNFIPDFYGMGRVTVASRYFPQTSAIHLQFSFCSAKNRFDRKEGQFIAAERLMDSPIDKKITWDSSIIEIIKDAILEEGVKRNISWMLNLTKENIR